MDKSGGETRFRVIMPAGADPDSEWKRNTIREVAVARGLEACFPTYNKEHAFNLRLMLEELHRVSFVIADLSFERPSCYYELGVAEALGVKVHVLALRGTNIHQTSHRESVRFYGSLQDFESLVVEVIEETG